MDPLLENIMLYTITGCCVSMVILIWYIQPTKVALVPSALKVSAPVELNSSEAVISAKLNGSEAVFSAATWGVHSRPLLFFTLVVLSICLWLWMWCKNRGGRVRILQREFSFECCFINSFKDRNAWRLYYYCERCPF